ncbi:hypothetical protein WN48_11083 [Eufriesea mexicana]|uniref:Uncharacterized protein n=1 Tax=Eufriesea mexicana TaxID=516756 RepID=A0A310S607_9HYME|nr:hypothetical protein WN48_11083 [Eufriesea mexicana]
MTTPVERGLIVLSFFTAICQANELKDYCSMHKFDNLPPGGLRFTKEVVTTEYANIGAFKALHCCLRGYRSIEWGGIGGGWRWVRGVTVNATAASVTLLREPIRPGVHISAGVIRRASLHRRNSVGRVCLFAKRGVLSIFRCRKAPSGQSLSEKVKKYSAGIFSLAGSRAAGIPGDFKTGRTCTGDKIASGKAAGGSELAGKRKLIASRGSWKFMAVVGRRRATEDRQFRCIRLIACASSRETGWRSPGCSLPDASTTDSRVRDWKLDVKNDGFAERYEVAETVSERWRDRVITSKRACTGLSRTTISSAEIFQRELLLGHVSNISMGETVSSGTFLEQRWSCSNLLDRWESFRRYKPILNRISPWLLRQVDVERSQSWSE